MEIRFGYTKTTEYFTGSVAVAIPRDFKEKEDKMNAIEMQMIALFEMEAKPIAERYNLKLVIDWENLGVNFITTKEIPKIELLKFITEMTAVLQKYPILQGG